MIYAFFDTDMLLGDEEYDVQGADYEELIRVCFQYSDYFSMWFSPHVQWTEKLNPYEITVDPAEFEYAPPYRPTPQNKGDITIHLHFYRACLESYQILINNMHHSIWDGWNFDQPAYLHFYRSDGTCFFMSNAHEGNCFFYVRDEEEVSAVVNKEHWYCETDLKPGVVWSPRPWEYRPLMQEKLSDT